MKRLKDVQTTVNVEALESDNYFSASWPVIGYWRAEIMRDEKGQRYLKLKTPKNELYYVANDEFMTKVKSMYEDYDPYNDAKFAMQLRDLSLEYTD